MRPSSTLTGFVLALTAFSALMVFTLLPKMQRRHLRRRRILMWSQKRTSSEEVASFEEKEAEVLSATDRASSLFPIEPKKTFVLERCNCSRTLRAVGADSDEKTGGGGEGRIKFEDTTCGIDAFRRGPRQKVVGFSFYSNATTAHEMSRKGYMDGIAGNLALMEKYYPGWVMRLYFDVEGEKDGEENVLLKELCTMACSNSALDLCDAGHLPGTPMVDSREVFPMLWRFFPTLDPQVDVYLSRDLDSRFSLRERAAVSDWLLNSDEPIHSMRDHRSHNVPLLGAAWGANMVRKNARARWRKSWHKILNDPEAWEPRFKKGPDQVLLSRYVWTWGRHNSVQHDSYLCRMFPGSRPFPTKRLMETNNHVASVWKENATFIARCPKHCRPALHPDWIYC